MGRMARSGIGKSRDTERGEADSMNPTAVILLLMMGTVYWLQNETAAFTSVVCWTPN